MTYIKIFEKKSVFFAGNIVGVYTPAYSPTKKVHKWFSNFITWDGMDISKNKKEDILIICFISVVIILMLIIQITGAI